MPNAMPGALATLPADMRAWLSDAERVLWWGRSGAPFALDWSDAWAVLPTIVFIGSVAFVASGAPAESRTLPTAFVVFGIAAALIGYAVRAFQRWTTVYAITDRRVLIQTRVPGKGTQFQSLWLAEPMYPVLTGGGTTRGTITVAQREPSGLSDRLLLRWQAQQQPKIADIADAASVYDILQKAHAAARATPPR